MSVGPDTATAAAGGLSASDSAAGVPVDEAEFRRRVSRLKTVPTLPKLVGRVLASLDDPDVDFKYVAELIEVDQSLTSQIIRLANSAFYSSRGTVSQVAHAITMLGTVVTRSVVVSSSVFDGRSMGLRGFWEHSVGCSVAAGAIAKATGLCSPQEVSAAGLLHDVGKVVLYKELPEACKHIIARARAEQLCFREVERMVLGIDHCDIAAPLVEKWRFPPTLAEPIVFHHTPARARVAKSETAIIHVANALVRALAFGSGGDGRIGRIEPDAWADLGLTPAILDRVLDTFDTDLDHALNYAIFD